MNGARRIALNFIEPHLHRADVKSVLDLCCGDCWLRDHVIRAGKAWNGVDARKTPVHGMIQMDMAIEPGARRLPRDFDLIVSVYGTQHMLNREANAWLLAREVIKSDGAMLIVARQYQSSRREMGRQDPLNGYSWEGLRGLALATGFQIAQFDTYRYQGNDYWPEAEDNANAFCAVLKPI